MTGLKIHILVIAMLLFSMISTAQVQVKASVDRNHILIGEQIKIQFEAYVPFGEEVQFTGIDSLPHFELLNKPSSDTIESIDGKKYTQTFTITSFDSGRWHIPQIGITVGSEVYYSDTIGIDVSYSSTDPRADYRDIKNIQQVLHPFAPYIPWVVAAVTVLALFTAIYFLRNRKIIPVPVAQIIPSSSAYEQAMLSLQQLKSKQYIEKGLVREYYTELNDIIRVFVFRKLNISALERTNDELIVQLNDHSLSRDTYLQLAQALRMSDFVKFAKYQPAAEDNRKNFDIINDAINSLNKHN